MTSFKDKSGKFVKAGDFIVYGRALGRCAGLAYGIVLKVTESKPDWNGKTQPKLKIIGLDPSWEENTRPQKASTLAFSDRVLVINANQLPSKQRQLLDNAWKQTKEYQELLEKNRDYLSEDLYE
jgi:hypothetical protein